MDMEILLGAMKHFWEKRVVMVDMMNVINVHCIVHLKMITMAVFRVCVFYHHERKTARKSESEI